MGRLPGGRRQDLGGAEFVTTWWFPLRAEWRRRSQCLTIDEPSALTRVFRVLRAARPGQPVVLNGFDVADLLAGMALARLRRDVPVVMVDCTWQEGRGRVDRLLTRCGVRLLAGPRTTFCVSSQEEARLWPLVWGVDTAQVAVLRWHHGIDEPEQDLVDGDGTVFTSGWALRDFGPVLFAAVDLDVPVWIAADTSDLPPAERLPQNVTVGRLFIDEFHRRLGSASAVVVSLEAGAVRSAGQTTYLDAMALGGLVVVSDTVGVREYVQHERTGLLFPAGDAQALTTVLRWALDPEHSEQVREIRLAGRRTARDHAGPDAFVSTLLDIIRMAANHVPKSRS